MRIHPSAPSGRHLVLFLLPLLLAAGPARATGFLPRLGRDLRAPFTRRGARLLGAGAALSGLGVLAENPDTAVRLLDQGGIDGLSDVGNEFGGGAFLAGASLGLWALGSVADDAPLAALGQDLSASFLAASLYTWAIKTTVDRRRPGGGRFSFPSGHTAVAFAFAATLDRHLGPGLSALAYGLALSTAAGRMEDRRHYLSDVIFGAALGLTVGGAGGLSDHLAVGPRGVGVRAAF